MYLFLYLCMYLYLYLCLYFNLDFHLYLSKARVIIYMDAQCDAPFLYFSCVEKILTSCNWVARLSERGRLVQQNLKIFLGNKDVMMGQFDRVSVSDLVLVENSRILKLVSLKLDLGWIAWRVKLIGFGTNSSESLSFHLQVLPWNEISICQLENWNMTCIKIICREIEISRKLDTAL